MAQAREQETGARGGGVLARCLRALRHRSGRPGTARGAARPRIALPTGLRAIYAIGDVHGCLDELLYLEAWIGADARALGGEALVIMLGDYVDRGPRSADVLTHLVQPPAPGALPRLCLCGNHEVLMLDFLHDPSPRHPWLEGGGRQTLASYGLDVDHILKTYGNRRGGLAAILADVVPDEHRRFLEDLAGAAYSPSHIFVHAGVRPRVPMERQSDDDLFWIRQPFLSKGPGPGPLVVHGHTRQRRPEFRDNRLGIDTGAYLTGRLTAARLTAEGVAFLATRGKEKLAE